MHFTGSIVILGVLTFGYLHYKGYITGIKNSLKNKTSSGDTISNYSEEVERAAFEFDLPYPYLMALLQLECGGKSPQVLGLKNTFLKDLKTLEMEIEKAMKM